MEQDKIKLDARFGDESIFEKEVEKGKSQLYSILTSAIDKNVSDVHLVHGVEPIFRQDGELVKQVEFGLMTKEKLDEFVSTIATERQQAEFKEERNLDMSLRHKKKRFRVHVFNQMGYTSFSFRLIPEEIPSIAELKLPNILYDFTKTRNGIILVVGTTGSGKSTTLAAMINEINENQNKHIITIEDPIEFVHENKRCIIQQREVGTDVNNFGDATRAALREDPDIVLVGELRDKETTQNALTLAETGHLVFGTLHTKSVAETVDRVVDIFPPEQQDQIRTQFSNAVQGIISQELFPREGGGRVPIFEIIKTSTAVKNAIKNPKTQTSVYKDEMLSMAKTVGTMTRETSIAQARKEGKISDLTILERTTVEERKDIEKILSGTGVVKIGTNNPYGSFNNTIGSEQTAKQEPEKSRKIKINMR